MEYTQQEFISMMQQKRWMCDVAEAKVKETPHLPISVNLKDMRHEHILILYSQYLSKRKLFGNLKHGRACFFCGIFEWLFIETICSACKKLTTEDWGHKSIGEKNLSTHSDIHSSSCLKRSKRQSCTPPQRSPQRGLLDGCSWHWGQTIRALHAPCHCESDSTPWFPCHPITWVRQLEWAKCTFNLVLHSLCSNLWVRPLSPPF